MSIKRDPLTQAQRDRANKIEKHRSQPLPSSKSSQSTFGLLANTFGGMIPRLGTPFGTSLGAGLDILDQAERQAKGLASNWLLGGIFRTEEIQFALDRFNQVLEERGYLKFEFNSVNNIGDKTSFIIPFYENPTISESRRANYASNDVMNRNEPWRLFVGARPREIKLSFSMTLPHILQFSMVKKMSEYGRQFNTDLVNNHLSFITSLIDQASILGEFNTPSAIVPPEGLTEFPYSEGQKRILDTADHNETDFLHYVYHMIDTIRSSVIAAVDKTGSQGPPTIQLKFGTLYNLDRFIATSYDLKFDGKSGYDNKTLLPRIIEVTLSLESYNQNIDSVTGNRISPQGWDSHFIQI